MPLARALWALGLFAIAACEDLPAIARNECGNRVVEAGEECDAPGPGCHAPESALACRIDCGVVACPAGLGCGLDRVCRAPSGRFSAQRFEVGSWLGNLLVADVTGDGRPDLTMGQERGVTLSFDASRSERVARNEAIAGDARVVGEVNGDGRADMVSFGGYAREVQVLTADPEGALVPVSHVAQTPQGDSRRLFSGDLDGDGRPEPVLALDATLYRVSSVNDDFEPLGTIDLAAGAITGRTATGDLATQTPCDEFAVAEAGTNLVHVYTLCGSAGPARLSTVALPMEAIVGPSGVFAGDVDGDGKLDLLITGSDYDIFVSYGLGDGAFHSAPSPAAGVVPDQRSESVPRNYFAELLGVAQLDGDQRVDLMLDSATLLTQLITPRCERPDDRSCLLFHGYWNAAVAGDFNRDGIVDQIGAPYDARELTFALGTGQGYNEFALPTRGIVGSYERPAVLTVGDFDGDLTPDVAFVEQARVTPPSVSLSIAYGRALAAPEDLRTLATERVIEALAEGSLSGEPGSTLSDLTVLAESDASGVGVGMFAGQTNRRMFSPLPIPELPATRVNLGLLGVALGSFRSEAQGGDVATPQHPSPRKDLVMLADSELARLLYFVPNSSAGFVATPGREPPLRLPAQAGTSPLVSEFDVEADGVDELIVMPSYINAPRLPYWIARRVKGAFSIEGFAIELPAIEGGVNLSLPPHPRDVTGDGRRDLVVSIQSEAYLGASQVLVVESTDARRLGRAHLYTIPSEPGDIEIGGVWVYADLITFVQVDTDPELELALAFTDRVRIFDLELEADVLRLQRSITADGYIASIASGDFDGDGVMDLAVTTPDVQLFWGEAAEP